MIMCWKFIEPVTNKHVLEDFIFENTGVRLKSYENHKTFINNHFKNENNKIGLLLKNYSNRYRLI
jgi:hypothetical protein